MVHDDTCRLLGECYAGIQMAVSAIDEVLPMVESFHLRQQLSNCKRVHEQLQGQTRTLLAKYQADGKTPNPMARGMSWVKTNVKLALQPGDQSVADLMIDGCHMGVKSLHKYCNRYPDATADARKLAGQLIEEEQRLSRDLQSYL